MAEYWRRANQLVAKIAEGFSSKDCEKMCFIYDCVFSRSFRDKHGDNPLRLLEKMRDEKVFSNDKLDKLANLMEELDLPLLKSRVDAFVGQYRAKIHGCMDVWVLLHDCQQLVLNPGSYYTVLIRTAWEV